MSLYCNVGSADTGRRRHFTADTSQPARTHRAHPDTVRLHGWYGLVAVASFTGTRHRTTSVGVLREDKSCPSLSPPRSLTRGRWPLAR